MNKVFLLVLIARLLFISVPSFAMHHGSSNWQIHCLSCNQHKQCQPIKYAQDSFVCSKECLLKEYKQLKEAKSEIENTLVGVSEEYRKNKEALSKAETATEEWRNAWNRIRESNEKLENSLKDLKQENEDLKKEINHHILIFKNLIIPATAGAIPWFITNDTSYKGLLAKGCMSAGITCMLEPYYGKSNTFRVLTCDRLKRFIGTALLISSSMYLIEGKKGIKSAFLFGVLSPIATESLTIASDLCIPLYENRYIGLRNKKIDIWGLSFLGLYYGTIFVEYHISRLVPKLLHR